MKLTIKSFNQIQGISIDFPCEIKGKNGTGKSTIIRALHYVLCEHDPYPQEGMKDDYSGCYSTSAITPEQLLISVELEYNGTTLRRESRPTSAQLKTFYDNENQIFSVENRYYIDGVQCAKEVEYSTKLSEMFGNIPMLLSASNFFKMKANEKLSFICETFGLAEVADNSEPLKSSKSSLKKQANELDVVIKTDTMRISERQAFREELTAKQLLLSELRANTPKLTAEQISENNEILRKISELHNEKPKIFQRKETVDISEIAQLKRVNLNLEQANLNFQQKIAQNIEKIKIAENSAPKFAELAQMEADLTLLPDFGNFEDYKKFREANEPLCVDFDEKMKTADFIKIENDIAETQNIVNNYELLKNSAKCTKCAVCALNDCPSREIHYMELSYYTEKLDELQANLDAEKGKIIEVEKDKVLRGLFEQESAVLRNKKTEIQAKRAELSALPNVGELDAMNVKFKEEYKKNSLLIEQNDFKISELNAKAELNAQIEQENAQIDEKNRIIIKQFNDTKESEITALKSKMHVAEISDNSEAIKSLENEISQLEKEVGALELSERELLKNKELSKLVYGELAEIDGQIILAQKNLIENLEGLATEINAQIIAFGFECSLLSVTKGGEPICEFRLKFAGEKYQSEAFRLLRNAKFCEMLAGILKSDLPIFVDESQKIVNEEIVNEIKNIKNICLISADRNYNQLTINKI